MNELDATLSPAVVLEQVYLIERDTGLLCRILGLYAARGIDVQRADYAYAARDVMTLKVAVASLNADTVEALRVLVEKAATLLGVIAAAEQPPPVAHAAPPRIPRPARRPAAGAAHRAGLVDGGAVR